MNEEHIELSYQTRSTSKNPNRKTVSQRVPKFDWETFKRLPNAADFVEKFYYQSCKRMIREIEEPENGTAIEHLDSMESVITRSIMYTACEIEEWWDEQNCEGAGITPDQAKNIRKYLSEFGMRKGGANAECDIPEHIRRKLAQRVTQVARKNDPLAEWLFTRLTSNRAGEGLADII